MSIGAQSYPELYTMLMGWNLYDQIWDLLSQSGLAYLPFIGIVLRNKAQSYASQETKDAGSTSLRRMEVDFIGTLLFIFFGVSPAFLLDPSLVSYTPLCPVDGKSEAVHPGNTGTTYDSAFTVPSTETRVPIWWYADMAMSEGITSAANTMVGCVPDLRSMVTQADMARISDTELKQEMDLLLEKYLNFWLPSLENQLETCYHTLWPVDEYLGELTKLWNDTISKINL